MLDVYSRHYAYNGARVSDYACNSYTLHLSDGGTYFTVFDPCGYYVASVTRPIASNGEYHWIAKARNGFVITDKAIGPKAVLSAIVEWASSLTAAQWDELE